MGILSRIKLVNFPQDQYVKEHTNKLQIVLHHTVSGIGVGGDIAHWRNTKSRIATCMIVAHDGTPHQLFSSKYWGYHLGIKAKVFYNRLLRYRKLDKYSIGIEIDSAGGLVMQNGEWVDAYGRILPDARVVVYDKPYRGFKAYEKYTEAQIDTVIELIEYWSELYNIPAKYNEDMWDVSNKALKGYAGVWSHTSFRSDKSDLHPQIELIERLKQL